SRLERDWERARDAAAECFEEEIGRRTFRDLEVHVARVRRELVAPGWIDASHVRHRCAHGFGTHVRGLHPGERDPAAHGAGGDIADDVFRLERGARGAEARAAAQLRGVQFTGHRVHGNAVGRADDLDGAARRAGLHLAVGAGDADAAGRAARLYAG